MVADEDLPPVQVEPLGSIGLSSGVWAALQLGIEAPLFGLR